MTQTVPTSVPESVTAGDTIQWTITLADYLASDGWVLKYRLINAAGKIDITSTADGDNHAIDVSAVNSSAWAAGTYDYQAYVDGVSSQRKTIATGKIIVLPNLAAEASGYDNRTAARKLLDQLDADLAAYGNKAYTQEYEIAGRRMKFISPGDFIAFRNKIQAEVAREEAAARIARGEDGGRKVYVRFGK
jgi:hypothetical protein